MENSLKKVYHQGTGTINAMQFKFVSNDFIFKTYCELADFFLKLLVVVIKIKKFFSKIFGKLNFSVILIFILKFSP
jgi:hypothetical protein